MLGLLGENRREGEAEEEEGEGEEVIRRSTLILVVTRVAVISLVGAV